MSVVRWERTPTEGSEKIGSFTFEEILPPLPSQLPHFVQSPYRNDVIHIVETLIGLMTSDSLGGPCRQSYLI